MKTNKMILSAGILALALASCTDLDVAVDSQYTSLPGSPAASNATMNDLYVRFKGTLGRRYMEATCLSSDEYTSLAYSGNWVDSYTYAHSAFHNYSEEDAVLDWMENLGAANVAAQDIANSDATDEVKALARVMRAFHTFLMMDMWGDVPVADFVYLQEHNLPDDNRVPRPEVAKYIESELLDIIDLLPTDVFGENYGKPTKYMAQALLAKLYINWPVYTAESVDLYDAATATNEKLEDCIKLCDDIINANVFALGPDEYRFKFNHDNSERVKAGTIKDFIYVMAYDTNMDGDNSMQWGRSHVYKDVKKLNPSMFGEFLNNSGGAYITLTPECSERFTLKNDQRNWMIIGLEDKDHNPANGQVYVYDPVTLLPTDEKVIDREGNPLVYTKDINVTGEKASVDVGDDTEGWRQGYRSAKWFICNNDFSNGRRQSNDVPFFRYADILLTKAEALVRSNKSGAKDLVNEIRSYAGTTDLLTAEATLDDVYMERGREFFDELWRRNDMIRFGHYEDNWFPHYNTGVFAEFANFDKTRRIFPIKKGDLDVNPTWSQNPGY
ncbi:MAG: RagB/SusD family nutrient uptake outer membrane protein [Bacteroidales bacterium]|nr:RagB/SusD family nutrient uptake outer membrane protein [Candidatus Liminaster caballi]